MPKDVIIDLPSTVKSRTEEIVIRNQDPNNKRIDIYQSLRPMDGENMGAPISHFMRSVPVAELADVTINGITGASVILWIAEYAAGINALDGDIQVKALKGKKEQA